LNGHDADVTVPFAVTVEHPPHEGGDRIRYCWMNPKQHYAGFHQRLPSLQRELPKVFVEREEDSAFCFRNIQQYRIAFGRVVGSGPRDVVAIVTQGLNGSLGEILIGE
jgi:hypothetical protein